MFVQKACRPLLAIVLGMCFYGTGQANPPPLNPLDFKHDRMSPGSFSLLAKLSLRDNGGVRDSLDYGTGPGATDGIDAQFGEEELPPLPPTGVFDVRWRISGTQGTKRDIRDTLGGTRRQITFKGVIQAGPGGYPFHLRWNRTELPAGTFTLRYGYGWAFSVDMKEQDSLAFGDADTRQFQIVYDAGSILKLVVRDGGGYGGVLEYGTAGGATDGIDPQFGEEELPPVPPVDVFDVRWRITGTQGSRRDIRDTLVGVEQITYKGLMQPGPGGYPLSLRWNRSVLPAGTFMLQYGGSLSVDMKGQDSVVIVDAGAQLFQIVHNAGNLLELGLQDNGGHAGSLEYGTAGGATDGIDPQFGEEELPPVPPAGVFDVRWKIVGTQGTQRDIRDTLGGMRTSVTYSGLLQPGSGGYPFRLQWTSFGFPSGTFTLRDAFDGTRFSVDMKQQDSLVISDPDINAFQIIYDRRPTLSFAVRQGWNIISLPMTVDDSRTDRVFPGSTSHAFAFLPGGYVVRDTLQNGTGYWLKFPTGQDVRLTGSLRSVDTVVVGAGWNMIGTISDSVQVTTIRQIPPTIIASQFYGYEGSYSGVTALKPLKGYWVKTIAPGLLILSAGSILDRTAVSPSVLLSKAASIGFRDSQSAEQVLFFTSAPIGQKDLDYYDLPPPPPTGVFDARFSTNRMLESAGENGERWVPIRISSAQYPLAITWDARDPGVIASLIVGTREVHMNGRGGVTITDPEAPLTVKLNGRTSLPANYALDQNYPNPFNPSTTIRYGLPHDSFVTLAVYNTLGQRVAQLVNEHQQAGYHDIVLCGDGLASGVYFCRLDAGGFTGVKKLLLLK